MEILQLLNGTDIDTFLQLSEVYLSFSHDEDVISNVCVPFELHEVGFCRM